METMPKNYPVGGDGKIILTKKVESLVDSVFKGMYDSRSVKAILEELDVPSYIFYRIIQEYPDIYSRYEMAQAARSEGLADEIIEIADTEPDPGKARNRIEARKWYASKMKPQKFGDRIDVNVNQTIDISSALSAARSRANMALSDRRNLLGDKKPEIPESTQVIDITDESDDPFS